MDLELFGKIMDKYLTDNPVQMTIYMPMGTCEPEITDTVELGPTMQFYILLNALEKVLTDFVEMVGEADKEKLIDGVLGLVRSDLLGGVEE